MQILRGVITFVFLVACVLASAQTPVWNWISSFGGTYNDEQGNSITTDSFGYIYIAGHFSGAMSFGTVTLTSAGAQDMFVAKFHKSGTNIWAKRAGGTSHDTANSIAIDSNNNLYIAGSFYNTAYFGNITLTSSGNYDPYVAKMDSNGNWLWVTKGGGTSEDVGKAIAIDSQCNAYLTGDFAGTATFGTTQVVSAGLTDIFIAKIGTNGNWIWSKRAGGTDNDNANAIVIDIIDTVCVTGSFKSTASFGSVSFTSYGGADIFVSKLSGSGTWIWTVRAGGSGSSWNDSGRGITADNQGNIYITGSFSSTASFGNLSVQSVGGIDVFAAKMDDDGNWIWVNGTGGTGSTLMDYGYDIAVDEDHNIYVTGVCVGTTYYGDSTIAGYGGFDVFLARLDDTGDWQSMIKAGGTGYDWSYSLALDDDSMPWITGSFVDPATFGNHTVTSFDGGTDGFLASALIPSISILSPNGGETWQSGIPKTIYWDVNWDIGNIDISISFDNGNNWMFLNSLPIDSNLRHYEVLIPIVNSDMCLIKIDPIDYPDIGVADVSDNMFTITTDTPASITLVSPEGMDMKLQSGRDCQIVWASHQVSEVNIDVSYDLGIEWHTIAVDIPVNQNSYSWQVPESLHENCLLRITDAANDSCYDWSNHPFTICKLEIDSPPLNTVWVEATTHNITWVSVNISTVKLEYSIDSGLSWLIISNNTNATNGSYIWNIPKLYSTQCKLRISDANAPLIMDTSDILFTIRPQIMLNSPNGGDYLLSNSIHRILWNSTAEVSQVLMDYSINNGSSWQTLQGTPYNANLGYYDWIVPNLASSQCLVRIKKSGATNIFDVSESTFSIVTQVISPTASFSASPLTGLDTLNVQFTDMSTPGTGLITSWLWNFGDESTSDQQNPTHTYLTTGVFTVSLAVTNTFGASNTLAISNYITVIQSVPEILLLSDSVMSFGSIYVEEASEYQSVSFRNTGGADLYVTDIHLCAPQSSFEYLIPGRDVVIAPGETENVIIRFLPQTVGTVIDTLFIVNNSVNEPIIKVKLSGTGLYVPPKAPENINVTMNGDSAVITWDTVTQNLHDQPITPDYYFVWFNGLSYEEAPYYFLAPVTGTTYTHVGVALGAQYMFYQITAVKFYRGDLSPSELDAYLKKSLFPGMTEAEMRNSLNKIY